MTEAEEIEVDLKDLKEALEMRKALQRLESNPDFVKVMKEGYLEQESIRLVHLRGAPSMQQEPHATQIMKRLEGIPALLAYFNSIHFHAQEAEKVMEDYEAELELVANGE